MESQMYRGLVIQPDPKRPGMWVCATNDGILHSETIDILKKCVDDHLGGSNA